MSKKVVEYLLMHNYFFGDINLNLQFRPKSLVKSLVDPKIVELNMAVAGIGVNWYYRRPMVQLYVVPL